MISAGYLTDKVTIMFPLSKGRDEFGAERTDWLPSKPRYAKVTYQRGAKAIVAGDSWVTQTISVLMRYSPIVTERCRLVWDGKTYSTDSLNRSEKDGSMTIVATRVDE